MSSFLGRLIAALLAVSTGAAASIILAPPQEVLERRTEIFDPSPTLGPKLRYSVGHAVQVYPASPERQPAEQGMTLFGITLSIVAVIFLLLIPVLQRVALRFRMLD